MSRTKKAEFCEIKVENHRKSRPWPPEEMQDGGVDSDDNEIESYSQKDLMFEEDIGSSQMTPGPRMRPVNPVYYQMVNASGGEEAYSSRIQHLSIDRDSLSSIGDSFSEGGMVSEDEDGHRNLKSAFLSMRVEDRGGEEKRSICRKRTYSHSRKAVMLYERDKKMKWGEDSAGPGLWLEPPQTEQGPPVVGTPSVPSSFTSLGDSNAEGGGSWASSRRSSGSSLSTSMEQEVNHNLRSES